MIDPSKYTDNEIIIMKSKIIETEFGIIYRFFFSSLQYLDAVILETLRMSSLVKIGLVHRTTTNVVMADYKVPEVMFDLN